MSIYYFTYGSNMLSERMNERIPVAKLAGKACLQNWKLVWDKISKDDSAKANLKAEVGCAVWGVIYCLSEQEMKLLDKIEGGYQRTEVVIQLHGESCSAITFVSEKRDPHLLPYDWYKELVLKGAREHSLPLAYIDEIAGIESKPDNRKSAGEKP